MTGLIAHPVASNPIEGLRRYGFQSGLLIALALVFSRGLVELHANKMIGYGTNLAGIIVFCGMVVFNARGMERTACWTLLFAFCFVFALVLSAMMSVLNHVPANAVLLQLTISLIAITPLILTASLAPLKTDYRTALIVFCLGVLIAFMLEFTRLVSFPASKEVWGIVRTSGLTGSYQHWSYTLAGLAVINLMVYRKSKSGIFFVLASLLTLACILSGTRNGLPVILLAWCTFLISLSPRQGLDLAVILTVISPALILVWQAGLDPVHFERFASVFSLVEQANADRMGAWLNGWQQAQNQLTLLGTNLGRFSQIGDRLGVLDSAHYESGILTLLLSVGWLGFIAYLAILISIIQRLGLTDAMMFIALYLPLIYYPGVESVPFFMMPAVFLLFIRLQSEAGK